MSMPSQYMYFWLQWQPTTSAPSVRPSGTKLYYELTIGDLNSISSGARGLMFRTICQNLAIGLRNHTSNRAIIWQMQGGFVISGVQEQWLYNQNWYGLIDEEPLAPSLCICIWRYTADPSRSGRGRWYCPFVCKSWITDSRVNNTGRAKAHAQLDLLMGPQIYPGFRFENRLHSLQDNDLKPIIGTRVVDHICVLYRRRAGRDRYTPAPWTP